MYVWKKKGRTNEYTSQSMKGRLHTHVDEVVVVSDEEVPEDAGLVEVAEADHVLDALHGGGAPDGFLRCGRRF